MKKSRDIALWVVTVGQGQDTFLAPSGTYLVGQTEPIILRFVLNNFTCNFYRHATKLLHQDC